MFELFGDKIHKNFIEKTQADSNLQEWEKTFLKTFSRHKTIFLQNKAVFCLNKVNDTATAADHTLNNIQVDDECDEVMISERESTKQYSLVNDE